VGRVVALLIPQSGMSAQPVSKWVQVWDRQMAAFHQKPCDDHGAYLLLDGVGLKVRRAWGPPRVLLLVAYGLRPNGERQVLGFLRAKGESQAPWEGFLQDLSPRIRPLPDSMKSFSHW